MPDLELMDGLLLYSVDDTKYFDGVSGCAFSSNGCSAMCSSVGHDFINGLIAATALCLKHSFLIKLTFGFMLFSAICFLSLFWVHISHLLQGTFYW